MAVGWAFMQHRKAAPAKETAAQRCGGVEGKRAEQHNPLLQAQCPNGLFYGQTGKHNGGSQSHEPFSPNGCNDQSERMLSERTPF